MSDTMWEFIIGMLTGRTVALVIFVILALMLPCG